MPENTRQREAWDAYHNLGAERSIERLYALLERTRRRGRSVPGLRTLYEWSRRHRWQDRIERMERQAREAADQARLGALQEMYERQAREGLLLQQKGAEWLTEFITDHATPEAAIRAIVEGAKLERLARGELSDRTAVEGSSDNGDGQFARFTDQELELLAEEAERLLAGAGEQEPE